MSKPVVPACVLAMASLAGLDAHASGGHWLVDDAAVFPPGTAGIELWYERFGDSMDGFVVEPAYTFGNGIELTGVAESLSTPAGREETYGIELKRLWRDFEGGDDVGVGWVLGSRNDSSGSLDELFAYIPVTIPLRDGRWLLHLNAGLSRDQSGPEREHGVFYGLGSQYALAHGVEVIGEFLAGSKEDLLVQAGLRFALGDSPGLLDMSYARNLDDSEEDWLTIGFAWEF